MKVKMLIKSLGGGSSRRFGALKLQAAELLLGEQKEGVWEDGGPERRDRQVRREPWARPQSDKDSMDSSQRGALGSDPEK